MAERLIVLRDRLSTIAASDLADRTLTPGEAKSLVVVIDALVEIAGSKFHSGDTYALRFIRIAKRATEA